jgi:hypothetical protein
MKMQFTEKYPFEPSGHFKIYAIDKLGKIRHFHEGPNLIVTNAKTIMAKNTATGLHSITKFGVGTGIAPAEGTNTSLVSPVYTQILQHTYPSNGQVTFHCEVGYGEANGLRITEYGLFTEANSMFSRKVRATVQGEFVTGIIDKAADLRIICLWTLRF